MKDALAKAEELGKLIASSDRFKAVEAARSDVEADQPLQANLKELRELSRKTVQLEKDIKPIEPKDKHRLKELQVKVTGNPKLQKLARVEADFTELMNRVNRTIYTQFAKQTPESGNEQ